MGAWGADFWQNDTALDAKEAFKKYFKYGLNDAEGIKSVQDNFPAAYDSDDGPVVALVIAEQLWKLGRLSKEMLSEAHEAADLDLENWKNQTDINTYNKHKKSVMKLLEKLEQPQPPEKNIKRIEPFKNEWNTGDVIAVKSTKGLRVVYHKNNQPDFETAEYIKGWYILFVIEKVYKNIITGYVKFDNSLYSVKDSVNINDIPYVNVKYNMHILGQDQAKKCRLVGHCNNEMFPEDVICRKEPFNLAFELVPLFAAQKFFLEKDNCYMAVEWQK